MKRFFLPALAATLLLAACGNAKVKSSQKNEDGTTTETTYDMGTAKKMADATDEMSKRTEELKKLKPLDISQLKSLLPEELAGMKRTDFNTATTMGYSVGTADYKKDDGTEIKLTVSDCAGEAGAGWYAMTYWGAMNLQQESEKEYTKTVDFNGGKAIEKYNKESKESSLVYFTHDRLLVVLDGRNVEPQALKAAAQGLDFKL